MIPYCSLVCGDALVNTYISIENQIKHTAVFYNLLTNSTVDILKEVSYRVKSGNFGHQVNSDIPLQTVEIRMRRLIMSRLIRIFTVCLVLFFYSND